MKQPASPPYALAAFAIAAMRRDYELWQFGGLLAVYELVNLLNILPLEQLMNLCGPVAVAAILGLSCYRIVTRSTIAVWAPMFWFRLACATYFGFGALVPHIVGEQSRQHLFSLYYFDDLLNFKINIIYCLGIFCVLFFSYFFLGWNSRAYVRSVGDMDHGKASQTLFFVVGFLAVGGILRYGVVVPYTFGLTQTILPGVVGTLSIMYYVGIYLLIVYGMQQSRRALLLAWVLVGLEVALSVASFAKFDLLLILIFASLGFISQGASRKKILMAVSCVALAYFAFQPLVGYGREQIVVRNGDSAGASLSERLDIVRSYFAGGNAGNDPAADGAGLERLSYVNADAFVVDRFDAGAPGDTLRNALATLIPRFLWPNKPVITQLGGNLNVMVFDRDGSALGIGHFAEAYWNFGWVGIVPWMAVVALILSVLTRASIKIMARRNWVYLPIVMIGVNMGFRVDGFFVPDILGPISILLWLGLGLAIVNAVFVTVTRRRRSRQYAHYWRPV